MGLKHVKVRANTRFRKTIARRMFSIYNVAALSPDLPLYLTP